MPCPSPATPSATAAVHSVVASLSALLLLAPPFAAQASSEGPLALRLPGSTKAAAMANVAIAGRDDDVVFYSPSQLVIARGTSVSLTRLSATAKGGSMATVARFGTGGVAVGANYLEYFAPAGYPYSRDDVAGTTATGASSLVAAVGIAQLYWGIRAGTTINYAVDQVGTGRNGGLAIHAGLSRDFARFFTAALVGRNLGPAIHGAAGETRLPTEAAFGISGVGPVGPVDMTVTTEVARRRNGFVSPAFGAEVEWSWLSGYSVTARGGVRRADAGDGRVTGGAAMTKDRLSLDYAVESLRQSRLVHRVGIRLR